MDEKFYLQKEAIGVGAKVYRLRKRQPYIKAVLYLKRYKNAEFEREYHYVVNYRVFDKGPDGIQEAFSEGIKWAKEKLEELAEEILRIASALSDFNQ